MPNKSKAKGNRFEREIVEVLNRCATNHKNIIITGGLGFIGSNLVETLIKKKFLIQTQQNYLKIK